MSSILFFWYRNTKKWFDQNNIFDKTIYEQFNYILQYRRCKFDIDNLSDFYFLLDDLIIFDQMSRNIERYLQSHNIAFNYRNIDDENAIIISKYILTNYDIQQIHQKYLYFVLLPLRHSKQLFNCYQVIDVIKKFNNISNQNEWNKFVMASYRSFYNASSRYPFFDPRNNIKIDDFKFLMFDDIQYNNCIDSRIKNLDNFGSLPNPTNELIQTVKKSLTCKNNLCVSLSGGVDSMVITHILYYLRHQNPNLKVYAVHIQHSNREEAIIEANIIEQFCNILIIPFHKIIIDHIKRHDVISRQDYENETRRIRFDFYRNMITHFNIDLVALGHHKGDLAENVLTNIIKGRSILDLPVMTEYDIQEKVCIWRPLLSVSKSEIFKYAEQHGIVYMKNSTPEWSVRGKLRNHVLPMLNDMFNSVDDNLYNAGNESSSMYDYIKMNVIDKINVNYGKLGFYLEVNLLDNNFSIWKLTLQKIFHKINLNMLKDDIIKSLMLMVNMKENKIINVCKNYLCYFDNINLIFLNSMYFNLDKSQISISVIVNDDVVDNKFNLADFIKGDFKYMIKSSSEQKFNVSNIMPKKMRKDFNCVLPSNILHKYNWMCGDCIGEDYTVQIRYA
jgi:tRNA(Ile)-lysidine synthetase-like protein